MKKQVYLRPTPAPPGGGGQSVQRRGIHGEDVAVGARDLKNVKMMDGMRGVPYGGMLGKSGNICRRMLAHAFPLSPFFNPVTCLQLPIGQLLILPRSPMLCVFTFSSYHLDTLIVHFQIDAAWHCTSFQHTQ